MLSHTTPWDDALTPVAHTTPGHPHRGQRLGCLMAHFGSAADAVVSVVSAVQQVVSAAAVQPVVSAVQPVV